MSAAENSFATSGKQTLAATTLEVAVALEADICILGRKTTNHCDS
jgi:hypothetical protein